MFRSLLIIFLMTVCAPAWAAPKTLSYAVYGGGLHVVNARLALDETPSRFGVRVDVATQGMLSKIAPWSSVIQSKGWVTAKGWKPENHEFATIWRKEKKTYHLRYDKNGTITERLVTENGEPDDRKPADPELAKGALDLPTGILNFLRHRDMKSGCEGSFPVYDGKRRFQIVMAGQKAETVAKNRYSVFSGPAISCTVEVKQQGGKWSGENRGWFRIQEDSRARGKLPRITMAPLKGFDGWLVPVRLDVASPYGAFVMHLTSAQGAVD